MERRAACGRREAGSTATPGAGGVIRVGTVGWHLPRRWQERFSGDGGHLARYAAVLGVVEVDSTVHRVPKAGTFARWARAVPDGFRVAVRLPRRMTHDAELRGIEEPLEAFLRIWRALGDRRGPLVVQAPPWLEYDPDSLRRFARMLRRRHAGPDALEARHPSWFTPEADEALARYEIARVAADPPRHAADGRPGGHAGMAYFKLLGAPAIYRSAYRDGALADWRGRIAAAAEGGAEVWCIFGNTADGHATGDALAMQETLPAPGTS